jgi:ribose transport system substrate-binding protein
MIRKASAGGRCRECVATLAVEGLQLLLLLLLLLAIGCNKEKSNGAGGGGSTTKASASATIAVIPKGSTHEHWQRVKAGAEKAGKEFGVEIIWKAPQTENDRQQQIGLVELFTAHKVGAIVVAPLDEKGLVRPIRQAVAAKIPVVLIDSGLAGKAGKDFVAYVGTDNYKGGQMAGDALAKALGGQGKVVMMRYMEGSASTEERERGFLDAIRKSPDLKVISDNQYAGATADVAQTKAAGMIDTLREADGVYCPNESSTNGMLLALRKAGLIGKVKFVGFDTSPPLLDAIRKGEIVAVVAQNPLKMGYLGVKAAVDTLHGQKVEPSVDTGEILITKDNIDSAEVSTLFGK